MKDLYIIPEIWLCNQSGFVWTIVPLLVNQANKILWWSCLIHQPDLEASTFAGLINVFVSGNAVIRFKKDSEIYFLKYFSWSSPSATPEKWYEKLHF